jgi:uncharacterized protein (TIGR02646 family)
MIKLEKPDEPELLQQEKSNWTNALVAKISEYGSYKDIPQNIKKQLLSHYRKSEITEPLFSSSHRKCAYCELKPSDGGGYLEVEHILPKSLFPEQTFNWSNFIPSCKNCNIKKSNENTQENPILNPYNTSPEIYFTYNNCAIEINRNIESGSSEYNIAKNTSDFCDLERIELVRKHSELLAVFYPYKLSLKQMLSEINSQNLTERQQTNVIAKLNDSLTAVKSLATPEQVCSGFMKSLLNDPIINEVKEFIIRFDLN